MKPPVSGKKNVTVKDLAQHLNVSVTTVSKALRDLPGIGDETRHAVKELAGRLGYRPNMMARSLKSSESTHVGVLITKDITIQWYAQLVSRLEDVLREKGYTVVLSLAKDDAENERKCLEAFMGGHVAGILAGPVFHRRDLRPLWEVVEHGPPVVLFNCLEELPVNYVAVDHLSGMRQVVEYLIEMGHSRIGYLCCPPEAFREGNNTRKEGFEAAFLDNGLRLDRNYMVEGLATFRNGYEKMNHLLGDWGCDGFPTVFFCHNDEAAIGAMDAIRNHGLAVPNDISIIGYDDIERAAYTSPRLSTVGGVLNKQVERMVDVLLAAINGEQKSFVKEKVVPELIIRDSVAKMKV